jgi:uncharacterized protein YbjQ (UPF0145 family)
MDYAMTTTTFQLEGYRIRTSLGVVRGITVRSRSVLGNLGASFQRVFGGNITILTELCEKARSEAFDLMVRHAEALGASGIVGVHYDATEVMDGVTEVLCYGTAVIADRT